MEQLFSQFADLGKLEAEKKKVLDIFTDIQKGILALNEAGLKMDAASNIRQLSGAMKQFEDTQAGIIAKQKEMAAVLEQVKKKAQENESVQSKVADTLSKVAGAQSKNQKVTLAEIEAIKKAKGVTDEYVDSLVKLAQSKQVYADGHKKAGQQREAPMSGFQFYMGTNMKGAKKHKEVSDEWNTLDEGSKAIWDYAAQFTKFGATIESVNGPLQETAEHIRRQGEESQKASDGVNKHTDATQKQKSALQQLLDSLGKSDGIRAFSDNIFENTSRLVELRDRLAQVKSAKKDLSQLNTGEDGGKYTEDIIRLTQEERKLNIEIQQGERFIKNQTKEMLAQAGSLDQMRAKLNQMVQAYDALSDVDKTSDAGQRDLMNIQELTDAINEQEQATKRFGRNVGNYASAFSGAFSVLNDELAKVRKDLASGAFSGAELAKLQQQEALLTEVTEGLGRQFTSSTQEARAFQEAAKRIGVSLGQDSAAFQQFRDQVGEGVDTLGDIKESIKLAASDTKGLDQLIGAAQGLAGAFGVAQGAAALFGSENEELEQTFVKLQAVMTVLGGLQAVQAELTRKDSILRKAVNFLTEKQIQLQQAQAVATDNTAKATKGLGVAMKGIGIGLLLMLIPLLVSAMQKAADKMEDLKMKQKALNDINTEAAEAYAKAKTEVATMATKLQMAKEGVISKKDALKEYNEGIGKVIGQAKSLNEAEEKLIKNADAYVKFTYMKAKAEVAAALAKEELKKQIQLESADATEFVDTWDAIGSTIRNSFSSFLSGPGLSGAAAKDLSKAADKERASQITKSKKLYDTLAALEKGFLKEAGAYAKEHGLDFYGSGDETKKFKDLTLESAKIEAKAIIEKNQAILNSERSTLQERIAAIKAIAEQQKRLAGIDRDQVLKDPNKDLTDRILANKTYKAEEQKIERDGNQAIVSEREKFYLRDVEAHKKILEQKVSNENALKEKLFKSDQVGLQERLAIFKSYIDNLQQLADADHRMKLLQAGISEEEIAALEADRNYKVKSKKVTDEELLAMQKDHENAKMAIVLKANEGVLDIVKSDLQKQRDEHASHVEQLQAIYDKLDLDSTNQYAADVIALNNALKNKQVSQAEYNKRREKLDKDYQVRANQNLIKFLQDQLKTMAGAEKAQLDVKARMALLQQQWAAAGTDEERAAILEKIEAANDEYKNYERIIKDKIALSKKLKDAEIANSQKSTDERTEDAKEWEAVYQQAAMAAMDIATAFASGGFERESERIQEQMDLLDKKTAKEIEAVNQSAASEAEKAEKIKKIEARAAAQKQQLERQEAQNRQRQAKFERDAQVLKIFGETMFQVAKYGFFTPQGIAAGIAGAASIAMLMAKPLPAFAEGTDSAPEGPAQVAEEGPELAVDPSGKIVLYKEPQVTYLRRGTKVYTAEETEEILKERTPTKAISAVGIFPVKGAAPEGKQIAKDFSTTVVSLHRQGLSNQDIAHQAHGIRITEHQVEAPLPAVPVERVHPVAAPVEKGRRTKEDALAAMLTRLGNLADLVKPQAETGFLNRYLTAPMVTLQQVRLDMQRASQADYHQIMSHAMSRGADMPMGSAQMKHMLQTLQNMEEELGRIRQLNKELVKKSQIQIFNETGIESKARLVHDAERYLNQMKR